MNELTRPAGAHVPPRALFEDAIRRALGWAAEDELRALVRKHTGVTLGLTAADNFSQEVAELVIRALTREVPK